MFDLPLAEAARAALLGDDANAANAALLRSLGASLSHAPGVVEAAVATRTAAVVSAELEVSASSLTLDGRVWIGDTMIAVIDRRSTAGDPTCQLVVGDVDAFPRLIALLVELGPRPRPSEPGFPLPPGGLGMVGGALGRDARREVVRALRGAGPTTDLKAVLGGDARRWVLAVGPGGQLDSPSATLDVVDVPERGIWLVHGSDEDGVALHAADPSVVWTLVSGLVDGALLVASAPEGFVFDNGPDAGD